MYAIRQGTKVICDGAIDWCQSLHEIVIPQGTRSKFERLLPEYKNLLVEQPDRNYDLPF